MIAVPDLDRLVDAALEAREGAYAPYSGFPVGCAVRLADGTIVTGANIENGAYPLGLCAERATIATVFSSRAASERVIDALVVVGPESAADCAPCGACRQWLLEHAPDATVTFRSKGELLTVTVGDLLPYGFQLS